MKIKCDFCKTEYTLNRMTNKYVKCAICGHVWAPQTNTYKSVWVKFCLSVCALLAVVCFCFVALTVYKTQSMKRKPIVAMITENKVKTDEDGKLYILVSGMLKNQTNEIYGVPKIVLNSFDKNKEQISSQVIEPPATFIDPKTSITFSQKLFVNPESVKKLTIEIKEIVK